MVNTSALQRLVHRNRHWQLRARASWRFGPANAANVGVVQHLILLAIARTYREACVLSLVSSLGFMLALYFIRDSSSTDTYPAWGAMMVAFAYLPATIAILRHPANGILPVWLRALVRPADDHRDTR